MKLCIISDTHNSHSKIQSLPEANVLIHCGDITFWGGQKNFNDFNGWISQLDYKHKLVIGGNHDFGFHKYINSNSISFTALHNSSVIINNIKFYGSPFTPIFNSWTYMMSNRQLKENWDLIPNDTDVLITHGPPKNILDKNRLFINVGDKHLAKRVEQIRPKLHCFGHIHENYGIRQINGITYVNATTCDLAYKPVNKPILIDLDNLEW